MGYLARRRRRKLLATPAPGDLERLLAERLPFYPRLESERRAALFDIARVIAAEKNWEPCGGLAVVDERLKLLIAAQAGLLLVGLEHDYFANIKSVLIYPSALAAGEERSDGATLGVAHPWGTVVLALDAALAGIAGASDGRNVVLHEFAHALDFVDHHVDGTPALCSREQYRRWVDVMTEHYERLVDDHERGRASLLNQYGASAPAEFFAVATEAFFEKPELLRRKHPELYAVLAEYFGQDPASWRRG